MQQVLEKSATSAEPQQRPPRPEIYQGNVNKMDVLNLGEQGHDRAVPFQLKQGTQKDTFVLGMDAKNPGRVINVDTRETLDQMADEDYARTAILKRRGNELWVETPDEQVTRLTQEQIRQNPHLVQLTGTTGVEILDFDPEQNSILIHKIRPAAIGPVIAPVPEPLPPPLPGWKQRLVDLVGPIIVATTLVTGSHATTEAVPPPAHAVVETVPLEVPQDQIPETLQCPATKEMTVIPNDSLTGLLIKVNGLLRYSDANGNLDVTKLYKDLACMLVIPENRPIIKQYDKFVANMLDTIFQYRTQVGPLTGEMIYGLINDLNAARSKNLPPGANPQLVIIQTGQKYSVPDFSQGNIPVGPPLQPREEPKPIPTPEIVPHPAPPSPQPPGQRT